MTDQKRNSFDVVSTELPTSFEKAFTYISTPQNLPLWTLYFTEADDSSAVLVKSKEAVKFGLETDVSYDKGTIDWRMISRVDGKASTAFSRLHELPNGNCAYTFLFSVNRAADETQADAHARQKQQMVAELENLRTILG